MKMTRNAKSSWRQLLQAALVAVPLWMMSGTPVVSAATPILDYQFNETDVANVKDGIAKLVGTPSANPPSMISESPSATAGDRAIKFEPAQYITVDVPTTLMQLDPSDSSFHCY